jgi:hypothetical protein
MPRQTPLDRSAFVQAPLPKGDTGPSKTAQLGRAWPAPHALPVVHDNTRTRRGVREYNSPIRR